MQTLIETSGKTISLHMILGGCRMLNNRVLWAYLVSQTRPEEDVCMCMYSNVNVEWNNICKKKITGVCLDQITF